jgi:diamine N-acetyltransferase
MFEPAVVADIDDLLPVIADYYREDAYPFAADRVRAALTELIAEPRLGQVWVARHEGRLVAYLIVTLGFSLEYGGSDAFVDELFVVASQRGRGLGREALALAEIYCVARGVRALHLEVEPHRQRARQLYLAAGFADHDRHLMTRLL